MKSLIKWAIANSPAMNTLMIASLVVGLTCFMTMRREVFPEFELEIVLVAVPYPGATPDEVEDGICQRLEDRLSKVEGVKKLTSVAQEGIGYSVIELLASVKDVQKQLNKIKSEVDQVKSQLPQLAEDPDVRQITFTLPAITVGIIGPETDNVTLQYERDLREQAEEIREELLRIPPSNNETGLLTRFANSAQQTGGAVVSSAEIANAKQYEIDVEVSEDDLRSYNLTLADIAGIIRRENGEVPGGKMKDGGQEVLVRSKSRRVTGAEIAKIKLKTQPNGDILRVGDVANVIDGFSDNVSVQSIDGRPGLAITVVRQKNEDLFLVTNAVKEYVAEKKSKLPVGYDLKLWGDQSVDVRDRINLLTKNGVQGLILVFIVLALFLELRLAFWVALGIPVSVLGAGYVLLGAGQTLNMLSMFAFLMALGIIVDDAIVIGENIFQHRQRGKKPIRAAIDGTVEVLPSVGASVGTTIIAFMPMMFVTGVMGKFIAVMPLAVIAMLVISLLESAFILPCHLAHDDNLFMRVLSAALYPFKLLQIDKLFQWGNQLSAKLMENIIEGFYLPLLRFGLANRLIVMSGGLGLLIISIGFIGAGLVPFEFFPKLDARVVSAGFAFPEGTDVEYSKAAIKQIEAAAMKLNEEHKEKYNGTPIFTTIYTKLGELSTGGRDATGTSKGSHVATLQLELSPMSIRQKTSRLSSDKFISDWRDAVGEIPGTDILSFNSQSMGPGGIPIEFRILASKKYKDELEEAKEYCKDTLLGFDGVKDVQDDARPGKREMQLKIKADAEAFGLTEEDLARTVRASYFGEEVQRMQISRHEVKVMVRYPEKERESMIGFNEIQVRGADQISRPITEVVDRTYAQSYAEISRINQQRSITISADVDTSTGANAFQIIGSFKEVMNKEFANKFPHVTVKWEGQQQQSQESFTSLFAGFFVAMICMFLLLTLEFRSYTQPLIIMAIIPFGIVGAVGGHFFMGLPMTLFSVFGMVALTGVIVNDSIVLVDFINARSREGMPLKDALVEAGRRRFRPVLLTSMTTVAGLIPILLETSFQAQVLVPMATSLCFGLIAATLLILVLVPVFYDVVESLSGLFVKRMMGDDYKEFNLDDEIRALDEEELGRAGAVPELSMTE